MNSLVSEKKERGRPSTYSREQIVERVTQLFWTHGYNELSLNGISKEIGLNRSSFYNTFKTKESLFLECLKHYLRSSPTMLLEHFKNGEKVGPLLYLVLRNICELRSTDQQKRGCFASNSFCELIASKTEISDILVESNNKRHENMVRIIQSAVDQGELGKHEDPEVIANIILSFMIGLNMHSKKTNSFEELQKMSDTFLAKLGFREEK